MLIAAQQVWHGGKCLPDYAVRVEHGIISDVIQGSRAQADLQIGVLMPACVDLQVNGGGGVLLNAQPTPQGLHKVLEAHRARGTGALLPTIITDVPEVLEQMVETVLAIWPCRGSLGLHVEGPHINAARRGTHAAHYIRPLDQRTVTQLARLRHAGVPVVLTLAPECTPPDLLQQVIDMGVIVSAGHSAADAQQTRAALSAGVQMFTHLFNAMPPLLSRAPGIVGAAILSEAYCGVIADGHHLSWEILQIAIAARPRRDRMFLVSDAMATVGGADHFELYGQTIHVRDGALVNAEGALAGAHTDMVTGLRNIHQRAGVPLDQAIGMVCDVPRAALGLATAPDVRVGTALSDLIALTPDLHHMEIPT